MKKVKENLKVISTILGIITLNTIIFYFMEKPGFNIVKFFSYGAGILIIFFYASLLALLLIQLGHWIHTKMEDEYRNNDKL